MAMFEEYSSCRLCPFECGIDRTAGERGRCGCDAYPRVARAALHHWEEPPISGTSGSGTIFFSGCNLSCVYCQNHEISHDQVGQIASVESIAQSCLSLQSQGAWNINFVTPTMFAPHIRAAVSMARADGLELPIVWNTSGYELPEQINENSDYVDIYLSDFKYFDDELACKLSNTPDYREVALSALDAIVAASGKPTFDLVDGEERMVRGVVVRHMLLPGHLDDSKNIVELLANRYGDDIRLSLMSQYTPVCDKAVKVDAALARTVTSEEYESLLDHADSLGIGDYHWQDGQACLESFIPAFCEE